MTNPIINFGDKLRGYRAEQNMTLGDFAKKSGVSDVTLSAIENGKTNITLTKLIQIAEAMDLESEFVFRPKNTTSVVGGE